MQGQQDSCTETLEPNHEYSLSIANLHGLKVFLKDWLQKIMLRNSLGVFASLMRMQECNRSSSGKSWLLEEHGVLWGSKHPCRNWASLVFIQPTFFLRKILSAFFIKRELLTNNFHYEKAFIFYFCFFSKSTF